MKKLSILLIVGLLIGSGFGGLSLTADKTYNQQSEKIIEIEIIEIPSMTIKTNNDDYIELNLENQEASYLMSPGKPMLPKIMKYVEIPFGAQNVKVEVVLNEVQEQTISKEIKPAPIPISLSPGTDFIPPPRKDEAVYSSNDIYPSTWYSYRVGCGLNVNGERVTFVAIHIFPVRYIPAAGKLYAAKSVNAAMSYKEPEITPFLETGEYDLVIIAPSQFSEELQRLVDHKNNHEVETILKTTEEIYSEFSGRDAPEQIKYFIKDAIEELGVAYVLLVGSIYTLPIRTSCIQVWGRWEEETLTDLYYSDVYNAEGEFCSWDSNKNNVFGETDKDQLDLYPDVHIGRLACDNISEVEIVVDKIIHYENEAFYQDWFYNMIFIGGNTFRWNPSNEGEEINEIIMNIMSDFNPSAVIWTSKGNFNRKTISEAINNGAGFLDYSGHGFEHGMGTYPPNGPFLRTYLTPYIKDLVNGYELPIIFFDACLTSKLDFILQDLLDYKQYRIFDFIAKILNFNTSIKLPCYAWSFVKHEGGGAIATIGATRTAFGGIESGAGKISIEFFNNYKNSEMLGQMMTETQNAYITDVPDDEFTVEEFILLGDPSLKLGGYP